MATRAYVRWSSGVILFIALSLVAAGTFAIHVANKEREQAEALLRVNEIAERVFARMEEFDGLLTATASMIELQPSISRLQFAEWVRAHDLSRRYKGVLGVGLAPIVDPSEQRFLAERARLEGAANYTIYPPIHREGTAAPVYYLEPAAPEADKLLGFDMYSDPTRREAMEQACREGEPIMSGAVSEIGHIDPSLALLFIPLYRHPTGQLSMLRNSESLCWGLVFLRIHVPTLFDSLAPSSAAASAASATERLELRVFDGGVFDPQRILVNHIEPGVDVLSKRVEIAHRTWLIEAPSAYKRGHSQRLNSGGITALGAAIALLMYGIAKLQVRARTAAEQTAATFAARDEVQTTLTKLSNQLVSETDEPRLLDLVTDTAAGLVGARHVLLLDESGSIVAWREGISTLGTIPPFIQHLAATEDEAGRLLVGPVRSKEGALSMIIAYPEEREALPREREFLELLLAQAVVALNNSRHVAKIHSLLEGLQESHAILARNNQELDQLAYATSHDLRAPLRGLLTVVDWVEEDLRAQATDDVFRHLHVMRQRIKRLESMVDGVARLTKAARSTEPLVPVALEDAAREAAAATNMPAGGAIEIDAGLPMLMASRDDLVQILRELFANAVSHGGRSDLLIEVRASTEPGTHQIFVDDNGRGIPAAYRDKVWSPFETLRRRDEKEHPGLGLALVKKLVLSYHGKVGLDDSPRGGTRVWISWPA